jgi:hypothetical protein
MNYFTLLSTISYVNKYYTWYIHICQRAQTRNWQKGNGIYLEKHHILPKSFGLGGEKDKENLVHLTAREHYIVHCLLPKFINHVTFRKKMEYALWYLSNRNIEHVPTARAYDIAKQQVIENIKARQDSDLTRSKKARPGKLNGMYGKTHSDAVKQLAGQRAINNFKGKTYEEIHGIEKADALKKDRSIKLTEYLKNNSGIRNGAKNSNSKTYEFVDPYGIIYIVTGNLKIFCKDNKLQVGSVIDVAKNRKAEYKGWKIQYIQSRKKVLGSTFD